MVERHRTSENVAQHIEWLTGVEQAQKVIEQLFGLATSSEGVVTKFQPDTFNDEDLEHDVIRTVLLRKEN